MAELEDLDGVGPARSDSLREAGYEVPKDLTDADPEDVAQHAGISEDKALETIVQAQNLVGDGQGESESPTETQGTEGEQEPETISEEIEREIDADPREADEDVVKSEEEGREETEQDREEDLVGEEGGERVGTGDEGDEDIGEPDEEESESDSYDVTLNFDDRKQYDVFHAAIVKHWSDSYNTRVDSSLMRDILDNLDSFEKVEMKLSRDELNSLHTAIHQERVHYQGSNRVEQLNLLKDLENKVNEVREEELF